MVPWWPADGGRTTLHRVLVHEIAETSRHAGHADIVRELIDGSAGLQEGNLFLPEGDRSWWKAHQDPNEQAALAAARR
jgi:hypothetical protein